MAEVEKKNVFVYYRGVKGRGKEIIQALNDLGCRYVNYNAVYDRAEDPDFICYLDSDGDFVTGLFDPYKSKWVMEHYTEAFLPDPSEPQELLWDDVKNMRMPNYGEIVLVCDHIESSWTTDIFIKYKPESLNPYFCLNGIYKYCIPYEGNEELIDYLPSELSKF